jgi:hypothetical protein
MRTKQIAAVVTGRAPADIATLALAALGPVLVLAPPAVFAANLVGAVVIRHLLDAEGKHTIGRAAFDGLPGEEEPRRARGTVVTRRMERWRAVSRTAPCRHR